MIEVLPITLDRLVTDGYAVVPQAILTSDLDLVRPYAEHDAKEVPIDPNGGLPWAYDVWQEDYRRLTSHATRLMTMLGARSEVTRVTLIKKAAGECRRYWHDDRAPDMPAPDKKPPKDVLALYYLSDTYAGSGCLIVRPGFVPGPNHDAHDNAPREDEVYVAVEQGDVVLMDPRLQHASLMNHTTKDRLLIRVWTENTW